MTEILIRFNRIYGKFYDRNTGNKIYRSYFGNSFSKVAFKRATEAIKYKSAVSMRYINLEMAHKEWLEENNKPVAKTRWIDRVLAFIKSILLRLRLMEPV